MISIMEELELFKESVRIQNSLIKSLKARLCSEQCECCMRIKRPCSCEVQQSESRRTDMTSSIMEGVGPDDYEYGHIANALESRAKDACEKLGVVYERVVIQNGDIWVRYHYPNPCGVELELLSLMEAHKK